MSPVRSLLLATTAVIATVLAFHAGAGPARSQPAPLDAAVQWAWSGDALFPQHVLSIGTPLVMDLDADALPEIAFVTFPPESSPAGGPDALTKGVIRIVHGSDGSALFTAASPASPVMATSLAGGDIDVDGKPEIVALWGERDPGGTTGYGAAAFEHDGTAKWRTPRLGTLDAFPDHGAVIADLDRDGAPEVAVGATVLDGATGTVLWDRSATGSIDPDSLARGIVLDLNISGAQELLADGRAFDASGGLLWRFGEIFPSPEDHGFHAAADLDGDAYPEPLWVAKNRLFATKHFGALLWSAELPTPGPSGMGGPGGAPVIGDATGDGQVEIGVSTTDAFALFDKDGSRLWARSLSPSGRSGGATMFDFDLDGAWEIVHADGTALRVLDGATGATRFTFARSGSSSYTHPLVADVDGDGQAEIIDNVDPLGDPPLGEPTGPIVFTAAGGAIWPGTRALWNQHAYHVDHVRDDGSIPLDQLVIGASHNTYRVNLPQPFVTATRTPTSEPATATLIASPTGSPTVTATPSPPAGTVPATATATLDPAATATATGSATATATGSPTASATAHGSPTATRTPAGGPGGPSAECVCNRVNVQVPPAVIAAALANPDRVLGWGQRLDPGKPAGPGNPLRACLDVSNPGVPYHPLFNGVVFKAGFR